MLMKVGPAFVKLATALLNQGRGRREAQLAQLMQQKQAAAEGVGLDHQATHLAERVPLLVEQGLEEVAGAGLDYQAMHRRYSCWCSFSVSLSWGFGCCFAVGYRAISMHSMSACLRL